jgi:hypothetical protein
MELDHIKDIKIRGVWKFFYGILLFVTYPLRHFFLFLISLIIIGCVLLAIPLFFRVPVQDVPTWYLQKTQALFGVAEIRVKPIDVPKLRPSADDRFKAVSAPRVIRKNPSDRTNQIRREGFKRPLTVLPEAAQNQKDGSTHSQIQKAKPHFVRPNPQNIKLTVKEQPNGTIDMSYRKDPTLPLIYEDKPVDIRGRTIVFNASEMAVGETYVILYGIAPDPESSKAREGFEYLKNLVEGKEISCRIVAYTRSSIATGICVFDDINLNRHMVERGFAENMSL